jgi:hypothetical protein
MRVLQASGVNGRRIQVSLFEGRMLIEFEAQDRDSLEAWLKAERFHYDWLIRIDLETVSGRLVAAE